MKFSVNGRALRDALATAAAATPSGKTSPGFAGVLIKVSGSQLTVTGSDGEIAIKAQLDVVGLQDGDVLIEPKPITDWLGRRQQDEVTLTTRADGTGLDVQAAGTPYTFRTLNADFMPPTVTRPALKPVDLSGLDRALPALRSSVSPKTKAVLLVSGDSGLTMFTTDRFRLTRVHMPAARIGDFRAEIPLTVLERAKSLGATAVYIDPAGRLIHFAGDRSEVTSRLLATSFPNVEGMFTHAAAYEVHLNPAALTEAVATLRTVAGGTNVKAVIAGDSLTLSADNANVGTGVEVVPLSSPSAVECTFFLSPAFLADAAGCHTAADAVIGWMEPNKPVLLSSTGDVHVDVLLMPVKQV